jgi:triosephosphate isomerase
MLEDIRKLQDTDIVGKTVIVRANLDVPLDANGEVRDLNRIKSVIPTLEHLIRNKCKIVLVAHLGRPNGEYVDEMSLMPVRFELGRELNKSLKFVSINECGNSIKFMEPGDILMLENIRFSPEEESLDPKVRKEFISKLANLADLFVNDDFGNYREHASVYDIAKMLPSFAGFHLQKEIEMLSLLRETPKKPYVAVIGGAKLDTKIPVLKSLVKKADKLLLGGAMAYTFLLAKGVKVGKSKVEENMLKTVEEILKIASENNCEVILPIDHIAAESFDENAKAIEVDTQDIPDNLMGMDIGPKTLILYREILEAAQTILWNGPMGVFEWENFNKGTEAIGEYIALATPKDAIKVAGGGDTIVAINMLKIKPKRFTHVSIGGGMMLKFLSGEHFPVLEVLTGKQK